MLRRNYFFAVLAYDFAPLREKKGISHRERQENAKFAKDLSPMRKVR